MHKFFLVFAMLGLVSSLPVRADQDDPRLPALFARLKTVETESEARVIEATIWQLWSISADDEVNGMMQRWGYSQPGAK